MAEALVCPLPELLAHLHQQGGQLLTKEHCPPRSAHAFIGDFKLAFLDLTSSSSPLAPYVTAPGMKGGSLQRGPGHGYLRITFYTGKH